MVAPIMTPPDNPSRPVRRELTYWIKGQIGGFRDRMDRLSWLEGSDTAHLFTNLEQGHHIAETIIKHTDGTQSVWVIVHVLLDRGLVVGYVLRPTHTTLYLFPDLTGMKINVVIG